MLDMGSMASAPGLALGSAVVDFLWQGTLIGVVAALLLTVIRSAQARYLVCCGALGVCAIVFLLTFWSALRSGPASVGATSMSLGGGGALRAPVGHETGSQAGNLLEIISWVWCAGVAMLSLRLGAQVASANRLRRRAVSAPDDRWLGVFESLKLEMRVGRGVRLVRSGLAEAPMVVGWVSPVVLVPVSAFTSLTPDQLRAVLVHELSHLRRHDHLINAVQVVIETVLFFHPVVWWLSGQIRSERENCCDDAAVRRTGDGRVFAEALAQLESLRSTHKRAALAANGGLLMNRINRILGARTSRVTAPWRTFGVLAAGAILTVAGIAHATGDGDKPGEDDRVAKLRLAVTAGMSKEEARQIYDSLIMPGSEMQERIEAELDKVAQEIEAAVASGRITKEEASAKLAEVQARIDQHVDIRFSMDVLGMTQGEAKVAATRSRLQELVASGELTEDEAHRKLAELERGIHLHEDFARHIEQAQAELRQAVETGEMTAEEARAKLQEMKKGVELRMHFHKASEEIRAKVEAGELTEEEASAHLAALKQRIHAAMDEKASEPNWEQIKRRVEGAVERGDMTREEADAIYRRLEEHHAAKSDEESAAGVRLSGRIASVGRHGIVLRTERGAIDIAVIERTRITRNGERARLQDLQVGDAARVAVERTARGLVAREIRAHERRGGGHAAGFGGEITSVERGAVVVETRRGEVRVNVTEHTRIARNGERARLQDLQVGDQARIAAERTARGLIATEIRARGR